MYYNFTKFHQNRVKNKKRFFNGTFFGILNSLIFANSLLDDPALRFDKRIFMHKNCQEQQKLFRFWEFKYAKCDQLVLTLGIQVRSLTIDSPLLALLR